MKNEVSGVRRPARAVYQAAKAVMIPNAPPATPRTAFPVKKWAAKRMKVMVRKKKTEIRAAEERRHAMRKMNLS